MPSTRPATVTHLRRLVATTTLWLLLAGAGESPAQDVPTPPKQADRARMVRHIDKLLAASWRKVGAEPATPCTDAEFVRRVFLDLTGRIPRVAEVRQFLADTRPGKRARLVERLLGIAPDGSAAARPQYATHFAAQWRSFLLPAGADLRRFGGGVGFETWLRQQFAENVPYDQTVRELLLAEGQALRVGPGLFYTTLEAKPEELATATSRALLGVQIGCAQCHDHPFDHWSQRDFWGYAAFFARLERPQAPQQVVTVVRDVAEGEVVLPESGEVVAPRYLSGDVAADAEGGSRRKLLAEWMTADDNPYFARAAVNRVWAMLFGRGIVEPVDDLGPHNPPSHPRLLDDLAQYFVDSGYDLRNLLRVLSSTRAYQLSSASPKAERGGPELFAAMTVKPLTAEQLYDSLEAATCRRETRQVGGRVVVVGGAANQRRQAFLSKFAAPAAAAGEYQAGIPQALSLMNGELTDEAVDVSRSDVLLALDAPFFSDEQRVETLFLATLSRLPTDDEREKFTSYVARRGSPDDKHAALGDILWALLNSAEFTLNH